jgi:hypothetical protein
VISSCSDVSEELVLPSKHVVVEDDALAVDGNA